MSQPQNGSAPASAEEVQRGWPNLTLRVDQLEAERVGMEHENKNLRALLERVIEHRQKSHGELVTLLTTLVSKLPINDAGVVVSKLVEHNSHVSEVCASLVKGKLDDNLLQPAILKAQEKTKRDLVAAAKLVIEELLKLDTPLEPEMFQSLLVKPENFFLPSVVRATRGFVKGQLPRERVLKEFGEDALIFFKDMTTDVKFNPRPKPEEIMLTFKPEFEELLQQNPNAAKKSELIALHEKIKRSRAATEQSRAQKSAFLRLSFLLELLHYYENQSTESPDVIFAQRLPPLIEQLVITGERDSLDEKLILQAESLLVFVVSHDQRNSVINNIGKAGGLARTLRYTLAFRAEEFSDIHPLTLEAVKHFIPNGAVPKIETLVPIFRLFNPRMQQAIIKAITVSERLRREEREALGKTIAKELGLHDFENRLNEQAAISPEREQKIAWDSIKDLIGSRASPNEIAAAIRKRLHGKYDADEVKQSWIVLTEGDAMVFVRVFCLLPYLPDGQTDPVARAILESYVNRLTHEKYATTYAKILGALRNLFKVKADSPALLNFIALVKWIDAEAANKISADLGMPAQ
jgi:hypothetical protein